MPRRPAVLQAIRDAHASGARLVGFCSGAFTLVEAGVLAGRRATAHWQWADSFRGRFPDVTLEEDVLFVDDGNILTAAGSAAALDLGLHIVRRDSGAEIASTVSRRLVFSAHRDGRQKQFIDRPMPAVSDQSLAPVREWLPRGSKSRSPSPISPVRSTSAPPPFIVVSRLSSGPRRWHG